MRRVSVALIAGVLESTVYTPYTVYIYAMQVTPTDQKPPFLLRPCFEITIAKPPRNWNIPFSSFSEGEGLIALCIFLSGTLLLLDLLHACFLTPQDLEGSAFYIQTVGFIIHHDHHKVFLNCWAPRHNFLKWKRIVCHCLPWRLWMPSNRSLKPWQKSRSEACSNLQRLEVAEVCFDSEFSRFMLRHAERRSLLSACVDAFCKDKLGKVVTGYAEGRRDSHESRGLGSFPSFVVDGSSFAFWILSFIIQYVLLRCCRSWK